MEVLGNKETIASRQSGAHLLLRQAYAREVYPINPEGRKLAESSLQREPPSELELPLKYHVGLNRMVLLRSLVKK